jgi:ClpP class serine protease
VFDRLREGVLLDVDSPGGEANGCFDAADFIRKCAIQTGKPVWAVANETACSAAYALASAASKIWLPRTAHVGSVGILSTHVDQSARDARNGLKWTYIYAGKNKTRFNPHEPLAPAALKAEQKEVDALYDIFVRQVAQNRRLTPAAVRASNADTFMGPDAVKAGFADKLGTFDQCVAAFAESLKK